MRPAVLFAIIWIGWIVSWIAAAFWSGRTEKRNMSWDGWASRGALLIGALLLLEWTADKLAEQRLWHVGYDGAYALAALTLAGFLFAWWARIHLGRLWAAGITRKENHHVVVTGPYAMVRHPIYTGVIVSVLATAAAQAKLTGLVGAAVIIFGLWLKARTEERFLTAELGADAYGAYRRHVPMLIPGLKFQ